MSEKIKASGLPTMESMGFYKKLEYSFPYHPMGDVFLMHLELKFLRYKIYRLDKRVPHYGTCIKRFWRKKYLHFVRKEFQLLHVVYPYKIPYDEKRFLLGIAPQLWPRWKAQRSKHILLESRRDRFGKSKIDFGRHLQNSWIKNKKYEFMQRELGLREEPYWRRKTRRTVTDRYAKVIVGCSHWDCWKIRIKYLPVILYHWFRFKLYDWTHPELLDIH